MDFDGSKHFKMPSGNYFDFNTFEGYISLSDIANGLSKLCRWAGGMPGIYSVAEHSVLCSYQVPRQYALCALMHDASEFVLGDLPRPVRRLMPEYCAMEQDIMHHLAADFGFCWPMPGVVKAADDLLLHCEGVDFFGEWGEFDKEWREAMTGDIVLNKWPHDMAYTKFMDRAHEIMGWGLNNPAAAGFAGSADGL